MPPPSEGQDAADEAGGGGWAITPHACRTCFGRILRRASVVRCADCGVTATAEPAALCGCGLRLAAEPLRRRRLFRCAANPAPTAACRAEIVIAFGEEPATAPPPSLPGSGGP